MYWRGEIPVSKEGMLKPDKEFLRKAAAKIVRESTQEDHIKWAKKYQWKKQHEEQEKQEQTNFMKGFTAWLKGYKPNDGTGDYKFKGKNLTGFWFPETSKFVQDLAEEEMKNRQMWRWMLEFGPNPRSMAQLAFYYKNVVLTGYKTVEDFDKLDQTTFKWLYDFHDKKTDGGSQGEAKHNWPWPFGGGGSVDEFWGNHSHDVEPLNTMTKIGDPGYTPPPPPPVIRTPSAPSAPPAPPATESSAEHTEGMEDEPPPPSHESIHEEARKWREKEQQEKQQAEAKLREQQEKEARLLEQQEKEARLREQKEAAEREKQKVERSLSASEAGKKQVEQSLSASEAAKEQAEQRLSASDKKVEELQRKLTDAGTTEQYIRTQQAELLQKIQTFERTVHTKDEAIRVAVKKQEAADDQIRQLREKIQLLEGGSENAKILAETVRQTGDQKLEEKVRQIATMKSSAAHLLRIVKTMVNELGDDSKAYLSEKPEEPGLRVALQALQVSDDYTEIVEMFRTFRATLEARRLTRLAQTSKIEELSRTLQTTKEEKWTVDQLKMKAESSLERLQTQMSSEKKQYAKWKTEFDASAVSKDLQSATTIGELEIRLKRAGEVIQQKSAEIEQSGQWVQKLNSNIEELKTSLEKGHLTIQERDAEIKNLTVQIEAIKDEGWRKIAQLNLDIVQLRDNFATRINDAATDAQRYQQIIQFFEQQILMYAGILNQKATTPETTIKLADSIASTTDRQVMVIHPEGQDDALRDELRREIEILKKALEDAKANAQNLIQVNKKGSNKKAEKDHRKHVKAVKLAAQRWGRSVKIAMSRGLVPPIPSMSTAVALRVSEPGPAIDFGDTTDEHRQNIFESDREIGGIFQPSAPEAPPEKQQYRPSAPSRTETETPLRPSEEEPEPVEVASAEDFEQQIYNLTGVRGQFAQEGTLSQADVRMPQIPYIEGKNDPYGVHILNFLREKIPIDPQSGMQNSEAVKEFSIFGELAHFLNDYDHITSKPERWTGRALTMPGENREISIGEYRRSSALSTIPYRTFCAFLPFVFRGFKENNQYLSSTARLDSPGFKFATKVYDFARRRFGLHEADNRKISNLIAAVLEGRDRIRLSTVFVRR